jgi:hypothetical protein
MLPNEPSTSSQNSSTLSLAIFLFTLQIEVEDELYLFQSPIDSVIISGPVRDSTTVLEPPTETLPSVMKTSPTSSPEQPRFSVYGAFSSRVSLT